MQFTSIVLAAAALAASATASVLPRDGARLAQFRVYGAAGCHDLNYGFYTVDADFKQLCNRLIEQAEAQLPVRRGAG